MIKFKLTTRDDRTGVRSGIIKSQKEPFVTPQRTLVSTEINYQVKINDELKNIKYPNEIFLAQLKLDVNKLIKRDTLSILALSSSSSLISIIM